MLGILPGVIGLLEATEVIKILLGIGAPLVGRLLTYDALGASFAELRLKRDISCPCCGEGSVFSGYVEYEESCAMRTGVVGTSSEAAAAGNDERTVSRT